MYQSYFDKIKVAARSMVKIDEGTSSLILESLSKQLLDKTESILEANQKDLLRMDADNPKYDRLKLTEDRVKGIANDLVSVAQLSCPVGEILEERTLDNGLLLQKKRVALGVVGVIFEARPNVTIDVFALCLRSGNACVLKGGSDAEHSNKVLVEIIQSTLINHGQNPNIVQLLPPERAATNALMNAINEVDVLIPRGSQALINAVRDNAKIPVIETGAGIVHTYFDKEADLTTGKQVIFNAKTRRVSVCNALDCLVLHKGRLGDLKELTEDLATKNVELFADTLAFGQLVNHYPRNLLREASDDDFGTEFLAHKMAIKTVANLDEALDHIFQYSSKHSEAIISTNSERIERFLNEVDAAAVYVNTSTAFTDGAQFGLGAEIGISTQKLHARGPMGLKELTSYKWIIKGNGQIRPA